MTATPDKQSKKLAVAKTDPTSQLSTVLSEFKKSILENHNAIGRCFGQLGVLHIQTGNWLRTAKNIVPHGEFEAWFEEQFADAITLRTGQRYMKASRTAEERIGELRSRLSILRADLDVSSLSDDEVICELPPAELFEIISMKDDSPKKLTSKKSPPQASPAINPLLLRAIVDFVGPPQLVLTTIDLTHDQIEAPEIVTGKDPIRERENWPHTALVVIDTSKACKSISRIKNAFDRGDLRECLLLLPADLANCATLIDCPQLVIRVNPIQANDSSKASVSFVLSLLSESDRLTDFAIAFSEFGTVKIPFLVDAK